MDSQESISDYLKGLGGKIDWASFLKEGGVQKSDKVILRL